jgi:hypothetical protein
MLTREPFKGEVFCADSIAKPLVIYDSLRLCARCPMSRPNPIRAQRMIQIQIVRRKVLCAHYDACLNRVVEKGWEGFACDDCSAFCFPDWSKGRWVEDAYRCAALTLAVEYPEFYEKTGAQ